MPRVLIIEDDPESRHALAGLFAREDWKVLQAPDGDVGIELALRNRPELILCDLLMPKSNGLGLPHDSGAASTHEDHRGVGPRLWGR